MKKTTQLRNLLNRPQILVLPGAYDALSARIIEMAGFDALVHTGYGTAASLLAQPDVGLINFREMCDRVRYISRAVEIPALADGDTGYGNPLNVFRTVKEYIWAGASGIFIEDQVWPKKCGHMFGKHVISTNEFIAKIRAASDARNEEDYDFVIMARTDALAVNGLDDAIERANLCHEAGADIAFIEAFEKPEQLETAVKETTIPLVLNLVEGGLTPLVTVKEAETLGFKVVFFGLAPLYAAAKGMMDVLKELKENGTTRHCMDKMVDFSQFGDIVNEDRIKKMAAAYLENT